MSSKLCTVTAILCLLSAVHAARFVTKTYTTSDCSGAANGFSSFFVDGSSCTAKSCTAISGVYYTLQCDSADVPPADMPRAYLYPDDSTCSLDTDTNFYGGYTGFCFYVFHPQDPTFAVLSSCDINTGVVAYSGASNSSCVDGAKFTFPTGCTQTTIGPTTYGTNNTCQVATNTPKSSGADTIIAPLSVLTFVALLF